MSDCRGSISVGTKVDQEMCDFLDEEAERLGVYRSELFRRILDVYAESRADNLACPTCSNTIQIEL